MSHKTRHKSGTSNSRYDPRTQYRANEGVHTIESKRPPHVLIVVVVAVVAVVTVVDVVGTHVLQNIGHFARTPAPTVSCMQNTVDPSEAQSSGSTSPLQCGVVEPVCVVVDETVVVVSVAVEDVIVVGQLSQRTGHVSATSNS